MANSGEIAGCCRRGIVLQAASKDIPLDSLDVVFSSIPQRKTATSSYPNNLSYVAYIQSPVPDAKLEELNALQPG